MEPHGPEYLEGSSLVEGRISASVVVEPVAAAYEDVAEAPQSVTSRLGVDHAVVVRCLEIKADGLAAAVSGYGTAEQPAVE